jgi:membrane-bound serine protease (ClpP class)
MSSTFQQMCQRAFFKAIQLLVFLIFTMLLTPVFAQNQSKSTAKKVYVVKLSQEIMPAAGRLIKKAVDEAEAMKADVILLDINTYGGRLDIADSIRSKLLYAKPLTVAFINNNAASAGALISLACDSIYMVAGATIGAATVVNESGEQMPDKYQSYMRGMMRATAETQGRNPTIAEAMVDDRIVIPGIIDSGKTLTFTAQEALLNNYCDGIVANRKEVISELGIENYTFIVHEESSLDAFINFLMNPFVNSMLILLIVGGIYFELKTPGLGFPTIAALTGAILYFAPLLLDGSAAVWEILIFLAGVLLLMAEIFIIPGFGVAGIAGIICIVSGLTFSLVGNNLFEFNVVGADIAAQGFFRVMLTVTLALAALMLFGGSIFNFPGVKKMVLTSAQDSDNGFTTRQNALNDVIGKTGKTTSMLRPAGKIWIDDNIYDAISESSFIENGEMVKVLRVEGYSLVVRKIEA